MTIYLYSVSLYKWPKFFLSVILLAISAATMIGLSGAVILLQYANAVNNDEDDKSSSCRHNVSDASKKCSKKDTRFLLPFP
jgi:hypothetical protein